MKTLDGINVWNRSCELAANTYAILSECSDPVLREQTTRSSLAVASSIAEGYDLESPQQFCKYLSVARSACAELRTQIYLAGIMGVIDTQLSEKLVSESMELSALLEGLINCYVEDKH